MLRCRDKYLPALALLLLLSGCVPSGLPVVELGDTVIDERIAEQV